MKKHSPILKGNWDKKRISKWFNRIAINQFKSFAEDVIKLYKGKFNTYAKEKFYVLFGYIRDNTNTNDNGTILAYLLSHNEETIGFIDFLYEQFLNQFWYL